MYNIVNIKKKKLLLAKCILFRSCVAISESHSLKDKHINPKSNLNFTVAWKISF